MSAGFRHCQVAIHREHETRTSRAVAPFAGQILPGSVRFDGTRLHWTLDLATIPPGDAPSIECVLIRAIERAVRP